MEMIEIHFDLFFGCTMLLADSLLNLLIYDVHLVPWAANNLVNCFLFKPDSVCKRRKDPVELTNTYKKESFALRYF